jgi:hypothetical protein
MVEQVEMVGMLQAQQPVMVEQVEMPQILVQVEFLHIIMVEEVVMVEQVVILKQVQHHTAVMVLLVLGNSLVVQMGKVVVVMLKHQDQLQ